jgi:hypothetical protein
VNFGELLEMLYIIKPMEYVNMFTVNNMSEDKEETIPRTFLAFLRTEDSGTKECNQVTNLFLKRKIWKCNPNRNSRCISRAATLLKPCQIIPIHALENYNLENSRTEHNPTT